MARFTKLPVTIEAVQFTPDSANPFGDAPRWLLDHLENKASDGPTPLIWKGDDGQLRIGTLEGQMTVSPGDWIIRGTKGELYPCKPDIFAEIYAAEDDPFLPKPPATLAEDLASCINRWSCENWAGNTPDFILAEFVIGMLRQFGATVAAREKWYGRGPELVPDLPFDPKATDRILYPAEPQPAPYEQPMQTDPSVPSVPRDGDTETVEDLLGDVAQLLRGDEAHHREKADDLADSGKDLDVAVPAITASVEKAERNARMAERVEAMLARLDEADEKTDACSALSDVIKSTTIEQYDNGPHSRVVVRCGGKEQARSLFGLLQAIKVAAEQA